MSNSDSESYSFLEEEALRAPYISNLDFLFQLDFSRITRVLEILSYDDYKSTRGYSHPLFYCFKPRCSDSDSDMDCFSLLSKDLSLVNSQEHMPYGYLQLYCPFLVSRKSQLLVIPNTLWRTAILKTFSVLNFSVVLKSSRLAPPRLQSLIPPNSSDRAVVTQTAHDVEILNFSPSKSGRMRESNARQLLLQVPAINETHDWKQLPIYTLVKIHTNQCPLILIIVQATNQVLSPPSGRQPAKPSIGRRIVGICPNAVPAPPLTKICRARGVMRWEDGGLHMTGIFEIFLDT